MARSPNFLEFADRSKWRAWLEEHHARETEVWLRIFKNNDTAGTLDLEAAVEEALCFGWIDSWLRSLGQGKLILRFSPRRKDSLWSMSNIRRVERLMAEGQMAEAGLRQVAQAKENGQWAAAIRREQVDLIPEELSKALRKIKGGLSAYRALSDSRKRQYIFQIQSAKSEATRVRRIQKIVQEVLWK